MNRAMTQPSLGSARRIATTAGGAFAAFYIFYTAAPTTLASSNTGAGLRVGIVMLIVVAIQPFVPLLSRCIPKWQRLVGSAIAAMSAGSLMMPFAGHWPGMALLGVGFGIFVVASTAWIKETAPPELLGRALGIYGFGSAIGGALGAPIGLYLAQAFDTHGVALAGGLVAVASIIPSLSIGTGRPAPRSPTHDKECGLTSSRAGGWTGLVGLGAHLLAVTVYATALSTLSATGQGQQSWLPVLAAFGIQTALATGRIAGGWASNRWTPFKAGVPAITMVAAAAAAFAVSTVPWQMLTISILIGFASGASQTIALTVLMNRANTAAAINRASAAWNICFDIGLGLGALAPLSIPRA